jgi:serine/threonine-protein kinase
MPPGDDESTVAERPLPVDPGSSGFENPDSESTRAGESDAIRAAADGFMTPDDAVHVGVSGFEPDDSDTRAEQSDPNPFGHGFETPPTEVPEAPPSESLPSTEATMQLPETPVPAAQVLPPRLTPARPINAATPRSTTEPSSAKGARTGSVVLLTTAVDALRNEEIDRTRLFIKLGWAISLLSMATVPFLGAPSAMNIAFCVALAFGMAVSFGFYRAFADPENYNDSALLKLAVLCVLNASVAVLFFGVFTATAGIIVIGIHFAARTEAVRTARWILGFAVVSYVILAGIVISGVIGDPGVFASDRELDVPTQLTGVVFVLASYVLAYVTARVLRQASLTSIEELQRATRLASQREALMDELRADLERALRIGGPGRYTDQVVGSYRLGIILGRGAMGEVYEAVHVTSGEVAAIKLLRRELLTDPTQVARFFREAKATSALDSPHVVRILEAANENAELPYLAMEMLQGTTLAEILRADPKLAPVDVLQLVRQVGSAIDGASAIGVVHRDLKPQNLYRIGELATVWKVLDFGVASLSEDTGTLTQGGVVGTPSYMAPEQAQGRRVDGRADVYALAAVAYRSLTGRHPFNAPDTPALLYAVVHKMPTRPRELSEDLPEDIDRWFALALAKAPDDRFQTGDALFESLHAALTGALDPKLRKRADALIRKQPWD